MGKQKDIILASNSPRRRELLNQIGLKFSVHPSDFHEKVATDDEIETAEALSIHNALGKAQNVARHYKNAIIIGVDTVVAFQQHILGKPQNATQAAEILRLLSDTTHKVTSGICLFDSDKKRALTASETTLVTMDRLEESDIARYIASGEGHDKAAGYAIQGLGALFIKGIEGDYFNVVGLPIYRLRKMLKKFRINV